MTVWMRAAGWLLKVSAFVCIAVAITFWVADRRFLAVLAVLGGFALMILGALLGPPRKTGAFIAQDMMENDLDIVHFRPPSGHVTGALDQEASEATQRFRGR